MEFITNPLIAGALGALLILLGKYADDKMNKKEINSKNYLKWGLFIFVVVTLIVYLATSNMSSSAGNNLIGGGAEEILTEPF